MQNNELTGIHHSKCNILCQTNAPNPLYSDQNHQLNDNNSKDRVPDICVKGKWQCLIWCNLFRFFDRDVKLMGVHARQITYKIIPVSQKKGLSDSYFTLFHWYLRCKDLWKLLLITNDRLALYLLYCFMRRKLWCKTGQELEFLSQQIYDIKIASTSWV